MKTGDKYQYTFSVSELKEFGVPENRIPVPLTPTVIEITYVRSGVAFFRFVNLDYLYESFILLDSPKIKSLQKL